MFISIKWKNTIIFTLMITVIISIVCALNVAGILRDARLDFTDTINSVFNDSYMAELNEFSSKASKTVETLAKNYGVDVFSLIGAEKGISFKWYVLGKGSLYEEIIEKIQQYHI